MAGRGEEDQERSAGARFQAEPALWRPDFPASGGLHYVGCPRTGLGGAPDRAGRRGTGGRSPWTRRNVGIMASRRTELNRTGASLPRFPPVLVWSQTPFAPFVPCFRVPQICFRFFTIYAIFT